MTDIFHFEGASYLLIVHYTSRFPVVHKLSSMTGQHVASQCNLIFSEYGWPDTLISDNGPLLHIGSFYQYDERVWCQSHYKLTTLSAIQWIGRKVFPNCQELIYKEKEESKDLFKCLMIYYNTPLTSSFQSPMQISQSRSTRSDLPMSNAARKQLGLDSEQLRNKHKHEHLPSHDLHVAQDVMFQDVPSKWSFPATITSLCSQPRSYNITTREGVTHRKIQAHLKPYIPQSKKIEDEHSLLQSSDMWTFKSDCKKFNTVDNQVQSYSRPKRGIKTPVKPDL